MRDRVFACVCSFVCALAHDEQQLVGITAVHLLIDYFVFGVDQVSMLCVHSARSVCGDSGHGQTDVTRCFYRCHYKCVYARTTCLSIAFGKLCSDHRSKAVQYMEHNWLVRVIFEMIRLACGLCVSSHWIANCWCSVILWLKTNPWANHNTIILMASKSRDKPYLLPKQERIRYNRQACT